MSKIFCSFCGKHEEDVETLVMGEFREVHICESCVERAYDFIKTERMQRHSNIDLQHIKKEEVLPEVLKAHLDQYVIGQEKAKRTLCVAVYNHYKRLFLVQNKDEEPAVEKSNVFLVGPTGTGKTLLASTIAKKLKVPFCSISMTQVTQAGYVGDDVESALSTLLQAADGNVQAAQMGIIYLDEADKMARKGDNPSLTRDVGGEGVQQALLKIIEGGIVNVPPYGGRKHPEQKMVQIDTTNILFILGGAFEGIENLIERRLYMRPLGFDVKTQKAQIPDLPKEQLISYVSALDLKAYGLIPELIGRVPMIAHLDALNKESLLQVLTATKNALIKQYKKLFAMEGITLNFTSGALDYIIERALKLQVGARGLRSICDTIIQDAMFFLPSREDITAYEIDENYCREKLEKSQFGLLKRA